MVEKLNRSSCLVKFCWFGIIAQAGRVEFTAAKSEGIKPIILVSCLVHSSKFKWSFFEHLTAKTRQPIGRVKFDFKTFVLFIFLNNIECDFENFVVVIKCKNYLEKRLLRILLSSLELPRRGRLAYEHRGMQSAVVLLSFAFFPWGQRGRDGQSPDQNLEKFSSFDFLNICT